LNYGNTIKHNMECSSIGLKWEVSFLKSNFQAPFFCPKLTYSKSVGKF
jgi:hypothetical protein